MSARAEQRRWSRVSLASIPPGRVRAFRAYVLGLCAIVLASLFVWTPELPRSLDEGAVEFWVLVGLAVIADLPPFTVHRPGPVGALSLSVIFAFAISIEYGGGTGRLTQVLAIVVAALLTRRGTVWSVAYDVGRYAVAMLAAALVLELSHRPLIRENDPVGELVILLAAATWVVVFRAASVTGRWLVEDGSWSAAFGTAIVRTVLPAAVALMLAPLIVAILTIDGWLLPIALLPAYALSRLGQAWEFQAEQDRRDPLTGLPNRIGLTRRIEGRMQTTPRFAVLVLGLDRFGQVNEGLGHDVGDTILRAVARRLEDAVGDGSAVGRLGGDQFAVVTTMVPSQEAVAAFAQPVTGFLAEPIEVDSLPVGVSASTGVAVFPQHGGDAATLLRHADAALAQAKAHRRQVQWYSPSMEVSGRERLRLLADLRRAVLDRDPSLALQYQPQVDIASGAIVGVEALLRWQHYRRGALSPADFLFVAEYSPVMDLLTARIIDDLMPQVVRWRDEGLIARVSVNMTSHDLARPRFAGWLADRLDAHGVPGTGLQVEVTETLLATEPDRVRATMRALREKGINVALDDFGTGYSSLDHLRTMPVTEVKVDRAYIAAMASDSVTEAIVRSLVRLGRDLGLRVVIEGIEDEHTLAMLAMEPGVIAQGWLYAPAMAADEVTDVLRGGRLAPGASRRARA